MTVCGHIDDARAKLDALEPLFIDEFEVEQQRVLKDKHLKLRLRKQNLSIDAIQFNFSASPTTSIRAAYRLAINEYNGVQSPQLMIEYFENQMTK